MITLTAVLFAGGESRRMGVDKAALMFNGEALWQRQLNLLHRLQPQKILVSARTKPTWCPAELETILDASPSRGPLSGLVAVLEKMATTHLLALAVDLPLMQENHLKTLVNLATEESGVLPQTGNFLEPLCAVYARSAAATVRNYFLEDKGSLQPLLQELLRKKLMKIYPVPPAEEKFYFNMNTAGEFQWALEKI